MNSLQSFIDSVYFEILKDSLSANFLFSFRDELALPLAFYYDLNDKHYSLLAAFCGSVMGLMFTYFLCLILSKLLRKFLDNHNYRVLAHYFDKTLPIFSITMLMPQMNVLVPFFAGFLRTKWLKCFIFVVIYRAIYYTYFMYNYENILKMM